MKRILLVDTWNKGHHINFIKGHVTACGDYEVAVVFPEIFDAEIKTYLFKPGKQYLNAKEYFKLLKLIQTIIEEMQPDIIHFLTGDYLLRFFGIGIRLFAEQASVIVTFHQFKGNIVKNFSMKRILGFSGYGIIYSEEIEQNLDGIGITNIKRFVYPYFGTISEKMPSDIRKQFNIPSDIPVIGCFGGTRYDKGLDLLLDAINEVNLDCGILIAGEQADFDYNYIISHYHRRSDRIFIFLKYLTDEEMADFINAADIIALPYRKGFTGASGVLTEGIAHGKLMIGSDCGVIGKLISSHELGTVFEAENIDELKNAIEKTILSKRMLSERYNRFRHSISLQNYRNEYRKVLETLEKQQEKF